MRTEQWNRLCNYLDCVDNWESTGYSHQCFKYGLLDSLRLLPIDCSPNLLLFWRLWPASVGGQGSWLVYRDDKNYLLVIFQEPEPTMFPVFKGKKKTGNFFIFHHLTNTHFVICTTYCQSFSHCTPNY